MDPTRKEEASGNIPHMHLFMSLKRKFPNLKDADITDSIQRVNVSLNCYLGERGANCRVATETSFDRREI